MKLVCMALCLLVSSTLCTLSLGLLLAELFSSPRAALRSAGATVQGWGCNLLLTCCYTAQLLIGWLKGDTPMRCRAPAGPAVAFGGAGFWWPYMGGVCQFLYEQFELEQAHIYVTSASAFPVLATLLGVCPRAWCEAEYPTCLAHWAEGRLRCYLDGPDFLRRHLLQFLPPDAHAKLSGRLTVSFTRIEWRWGLVPVLHNERASQFRSNQELVSCVLASMNLPGVFFRGQIRWRGAIVGDGAYSSCEWNQMEWVGGEPPIGVEVLPFGPSDIQPSVNLAVKNAALPCSMTETLQMYEAGYRDAKAARHIFLERGWSPKAAPPT